MIFFSGFLCDFNFVAKFFFSQIEILYIYYDAMQREGKKLKREKRKQKMYLVNVKMVWLPRHIFNDDEWSESFVKWPIEHMAQYK